MIKLLLRNKSFMIGFLFLGGLLLASIANTVFNEGKIKQVQVIYNNGQVVEKAPFPPSMQFPLGTDMNGYDLLHIIIEGAKYTIGISLTVALLQIIMGGLIGLLVSGYFPKVFNRLENFLDSFSVLPITLVAYFILVNVLTMPIDGFQQPFYVRALFEMVILICLPLPTIILYLGKEVTNLLSIEFVRASQTLGASTSRILFKHIFRHLRQRVIILFIQQFNQVLIVLAHLGLLKMFFAGTVIDYSPIQEPPKTLSFEWSGLIGDYIGLLYVHPMIVMVPILFFALTIISANLILKGIERVNEVNS